MAAGAPDPGSPPVLQGDTSPGHRNYVWAWVIGLIVLGLIIWALAHVALGVQGSTQNSTFGGPPASRRTSGNTPPGGTPP